MARVALTAAARGGTAAGLRLDRLSARPRLVVGALAILLPLLLAPFLLHPKLGLALAVAAVLIPVSAVSAAYPIALSAIPTLVIALLQSDPFPQGAVVGAIFAATSVAIAVGLFSGRVRLPLTTLMSVPVLASAALALLMFARLTASASPDYGSLKTKLFLLQNVLFLLAGIVIAQRRRTFDVYLLLSLVLATMSALLLLYRLAQGEAHAVFDSRFTISSNEGPIQFGRQSAEGLIIGTYALLAVRPGTLRKIALVATPLLGVALVAAGSRGPVLGAIVGLVVLLSLALTDRASRSRLLLLAGCGIVAALLVGQLLPGQSISRSLSFLTGSGSGLSSNGRSALWSQAYSLFRDHPLFGIGTGGFFAANGVEHYPHNLLLEVAAELGVLGLALVIAFLAATVVRLVRSWRFSVGPDRLRVAVIAALFAAATTNALFSADIQENPSVWLTAGFAVGLSLIRGAPREEAPATDAA